MGYSIIDIYEYIRIPKRWYDGLENGKWGRDFCIELGIRLASLDLKTVLAASPFSGLTDSTFKKLLEHVRVEWTKFNPSMEDYQNIDFFLDAFEMVGDGIRLSWERAIELSKVLLASWGLLSDWIKFLESRKEHIAFGVWRRLYQFSTMMIDKGFARYDQVSDRWPDFLVQFHDFVVKQQN